MGCRQIMALSAGVTLLCVLAVNPVSGMSKAPREPAFMEGRVVLRFHEGVDTGRAYQIIQSEGGSVSRVLERTRLYLVLLPDNVSVEEAVETYSKYPEILSAEPDYRAERTEKR